MSYEQPDLPAPPDNTGYRPRRVKSTVEMSEGSKLLAALVKEMYWLATSRAARTQQVQLGPSELGDPCDGKLMRRLLGLTPANHGRADGWAATVGTAVHAWLAEALTEYDSGRGRFLIEHPIRIPAPAALGPERYPDPTDPSQSIWDVKGTLDWYDRKDRRVIDHKALGDYTLSSLHSSGEPDVKYQIQLQVYAYGVALQGEEPEEVAVVAWPRTEASLSKLYVWTAPYDPDVAREALDRRERLIKARLERGDNDPAGLLAETPIEPSALCRYCYFYRPHGLHIVEGCRGQKDSP